MTEGAAAAEQGRELLALYDAALPQVYGYVLRRCGSASVAEDLTSETFMAAVDAVSRHRVPDLTVGWLIGVARHKLLDHWRRQERQQRTLRSVASDVAGELDLLDDWDIRLDGIVAQQILGRLGAHHRGALTLRYLDGLAVAEVAALMGRTVGATEVLLVRARRAFRQAYESDSETGREDR